MTIFLVAYGLSAFAGGGSHYVQVPTRTQREVQTSRRTTPTPSEDVVQYSEQISRVRARNDFRGQDPRIVGLVQMPTLQLLEQKPQSGSEEERFTLQAAQFSRVQDLKRQLGNRDGNPEVLKLFAKGESAELGKLMANMFNRRLDFANAMNGFGGDQKLKGQMLALWARGQELIASGRQPKNAFEAALVEGVRAGLANRQEFWNTVDEVLKNGDTTPLKDWSNDFGNYLQALQLTDRNGGPAGSPKLTQWFVSSKAKMQQLFGVTSLQDINFRNPYPQMEEAMASRRKLAENKERTGDEDPSVLNTARSDE